MLNNPHKQIYLLTNSAYYIPLLGIGHFMYERKKNKGTNEEGVTNIHPNVIRKNH